MQINLHSWIRMKFIVFVPYWYVSFHSIMRLLKFRWKKLNINVIFWNWMNWVWKSNTPWAWTLITVLLVGRILPHIFPVGLGYWTTNIQWMDCHTLRWGLRRLMRWLLAIVHFLSRLLVIELSNNYILREREKGKRELHVHVLIFLTSHIITW